MTRRRGNPFLWGSVFALLLSGIVALGYTAGRWQALRDFEYEIDAFASHETLAGAASGVADLAELAKAFTDPQRALAEMGDYAWSVFCVPTPFVGSAPAPGRHGATQINELQFRHPKPLEIPKPGGTVRIFVTGGSTAFGVGVSDSDTIPAFLQALLTERLAPETGKRYEVVNTANPAWASTHERIQIENRLVELEPDLIVALSGNNDAHWSFLGRDTLWFRTYKDHHFWNLLRMVHGRASERPFPPDQDSFSPDPVPPAEVLRRLTRNVHLACAATAAADTPFLYALQPSLPVCRKALSERERRLAGREVLGDGSAVYFAECYERFRAALPALDFESYHFVDLSTAFDDLDAQTDVFLDSYHFGDRGNRILAERLFERVVPLLK